MCGGDASICQITLNTCHHYATLTSVNYINLYIHLYSHKLQLQKQNLKKKQRKKVHTTCQRTQRIKCILTEFIHRKTAATQKHSSTTSINNCRVLLLARNNTRCTKARKATHGLDGQHQDVDRTPRGRVNKNDRGQG